MHEPDPDWGEPSILSNPAGYQTTAPRVVMQPAAPARELPEVSE